MKFRKIFVVLVVLSLFFIFINGSFENVNTKVSHAVSTNAFETYMRMITVGCGSVGLTNVTVTIAHNIKNGKSWLYSIDREDYFYIPFATICQIKTVNTDKKIGEYFTGRISIKMTVVYSISKTDYETIEYINL